MIKNFALALIIGVIVGTYSSIYIAANALIMMGLSKDHLHSHIAWDPGSSHLTHTISKSLHSHAILATHSRLLIDLNRDEKHKDLIIQFRDGIKIPGNFNLKNNLPL